MEGVAIHQAARTKQGLCRNKHWDPPRSPTTLHVRMPKPNCSCSKLESPVYLPILGPAIGCRHKCELQNETSTVGVTLFNLWTHVDTHHLRFRVDGRPLKARGAGSKTERSRILATGCPLARIEATSHARFRCSKDSPEDCPERYLKMSR